MTKQNNALRLAEQYDYGDPVAHSNMWKAAVCNELRRQHARIAELEAEQQAAPKAAPGERLTRDQIRKVFMAHGFTIKEGQTDLKQYVYDAAHALLELVAAPQQEAQEPVGKYLTVVYRDLTRDEAQALIDHEKMSAASWSHALHERDMAKAAPQPAPAPLSDDVVKDAARYRWLIDQHWIQTEVEWRLISTDQDSTIKQLDAAIDAAIAAQGGE